MRRMIVKRFGLVALLAAGLVLLGREEAVWDHVQKFIDESPLDLGETAASPQWMEQAHASSFAAQANAGRDRTVQVGDQVMLDASRSLSPSAASVDMTYDWQVISLPAGSTATLDDPASLRPSFVVDLPGDYEFEVLVANTKGSSSDRVVISTTNATPVADAGPEQLVALGATTHLDASRSHDDDGDQLTYSWSLVQLPAGSAATLSDPTALRPSVFIDVEGDYRAELVVSDGLVSSDPDQVRFSTDFVDPTPEVGPHRRVQVGDTLNFDDRFTTHPGHREVLYGVYMLDQPPGSNPTIYHTNGRDIRWAFEVDTAGSYVIGALVLDDVAGTNRMLDTIIVSTEQSPPSADAGPDQATVVGSTVELDGAGSQDPDGNLLSYRWALVSRPAGSTAVLDDPVAVRPSFTIDQPGEYVAQLIVDDGTQPSHPDTVVISTENSRPIANAGPDILFARFDTVQLDGSASSDPDGDPLTYRWTILRTPDHDDAVLSDPTIVNPTFVDDAAGKVYAIQLVVSDGVLQSEPSVILATRANAGPVAGAGPDQAVATGNTVQLDGSGTNDLDGDPLTYRWALIAKPVGSTAALSDTTLQSPTFVPDLPGTYVAQLFVHDTFRESAADTVVIEATGSIPIADAGPDQVVSPGDTVQLDGTGSLDPQGDPLNYDWQLIAQPGGSSASLSNPTSATPSFVADLLGNYIAQLVVDDGTDFSAPNSVTITAQGAGGGPNQPPALDPVGNQSVALGTSLSLLLSASDPNGDDLTFSATPLPLPDGASLGGQNGLFTFTPNEDQVGTIDIDFLVSDGLLTDSESVTITVTGPQPGGVTAMTGRLLDTGDYEAGTETPIVGATVSILGSGVSTTTDANGDFTLSGIGSGQQVFDVDSSTVTSAPAGEAFADFREAFTLIADVTNVIERPIFLPLIDADSLTTVNPAQTTVVVNPNISTSLEVPPNTAKDESGNDFTGAISITEVPVELAPVALPEGIDPALLISIQPVGVTFSDPVPLSMPNLDNMPAGAELDLYSLDPDSGQFVIVGTGQVSADGTTIETISGGVRSASWHGFLPALLGALGGLLGGDNDPPGCPKDDEGNPVCCAPTGSSTAMCNGNLSEVHALASHRSFGVSRRLRFVYNSTLADPQPIVKSETTIRRRSAVPNSLSASLRVGGVEQGEPVFTSTSNPSPLSESVNETVIQAVQFDASLFSTGVYLTELTTTSHFTQSSVGNSLFDRVLVNNQVNSPFGAGWTLTGLERLHLQADGSAVLTKGSGTVLRFLPPGGLDLVGQVVALGTAPPSLAPGEVESDIQIAVLGEAANVTLATPLEVSDVVPEGAVGFGTTHGLPAGLTISSTLIHFDPATAGTALTGVATFDEEILGVILDDAMLDASDGTLGAPGTSYPSGETGRGATESDTVTLSADRRTLTFTLQEDGDLDQIRIVTKGATSTLVESTFDFNEEGWTVVENGSTGGSYIADGGNPGGHFFSFDGFGGPAWRWNAPLKFLGDQSAAYGGYLTYDQKVNSTSSQFNAIQDVRLVGAGLTLFFDASYNPGGLFWTRTIAPLKEGPGWTIEGTPDQPSAAQFQAVLADITELWILGEYKTQSDNNRLDNVAYLAPDGAAVAVDRFTAPDGNFSVLRENPDDSFTRRLKNGTEKHYDADGFLTSMVDRNGNATLYGYDAQDRLTSVTDPAGLVTTLAYDGAGKLQSVTDPASRVTHFEVDASGDLIRIEDPDGSERFFAYDARHRLTTQTSKRGFDTTYDYGFHGRNVQANRPDLSTRKVASAQVVGLVDPASGEGTEGNPAPYVRPSEVVATYTDGNNNTTTYEVNAFGSVTRITDALNRVTLFERDGDGLATRIIHPNMRIDEKVYDSRGNLLRVTEAVGTSIERSVIFEYEPNFNEVTKIIDPEQNTLLVTLDEKGNTLTLTYPEQSVTSVTYGDSNCPGEPTSITHGTGLPEEATTSLTYDPSTCNLIQTIDPLNNATTSMHDSAGQVTQVVDAESQVLRILRDALNRRTKVIDPKNNLPNPACGTAGVTCFAYDNAGNIESVTDGKANFSMFQYDQLDRVKLRTDPLGVSENFVYDGNGNLVEMTDRKGQVTSLVYDLVDRLNEKIFQPGTSEESTRTFTYNLANNVTLISDADSVLSFTYDLLNRPETASTAGSPNQPTVNLSYGYDKIGNRLSMNDDLLGSSFYTYNGLNRLTNLAAPGGNFSFSYDALSRRTSISRDNGVATSFAYDVAGRLNNITHDRSGVTISSFTYSVDGVGKRTTLDQTRPSLPATNSLTFDYDELDQLTSATSALSGGIPESYNYDSVGNRDSSHRASTYVTGVGNRLLEDDAFCYTYDANGNLHTKTAKLAGTCTGGVTTYSWDVENRLTRIDFANFTYAAYRYDSIGRRIEKDANGIVTRYVYDGEDILYEYTGTNLLLARYTHGPGVDEPLLAQRDLDLSGAFEANESFAYHTDALGSVTEITDHSGVTVASKLYDGYGNILAETGSLAQPYAFTAREFDSENGSYFYRARYYNPESGRFITEDPIGFAGGDQNMYRYVLNGPINRADPFGLSPDPFSDLADHKAGIPKDSDLDCVPGCNLILQPACVGAALVGGAVGTLVLGGPTFGVAAPKGAIIGIAVGFGLCQAAKIKKCQVECEKEDDKECNEEGN
ncbi:MAG: PKD domain-containing protein [Pseudomonadota bacterium]